MQLPFSKVSGNWSSEEVNLIGGGTSISDFDFSKLKGVTVGCNRVAFELNTDYCVSLDQHFVREYQNQIAEYAVNGGKVVLAMPVNEDGHRPIKGVTYVVRDRHHGLSKDPTRIYGVNSGYAALGLAYLMGAKRINLFGFDMSYGKDGKTHFHSGYPWHNKNSHRFMSQWTNAFEAANEQLLKDDVKVINYVGDPESKIEWFEKRQLHEYD